ncbi:MAG: clan AA aspartic protease [Gemmatimonadaceae bacterium]|nr:clan AA aspartic protease [Caulobacter sp.]
MLDGARRLTVQVFLNGQGPYPFLVDTGASASVISAVLADSLALPRGPDVTLHGIAGAQRVRTVALDTIRVSRRERRHLNLSVLPERYLNAPGLLGMDWLGERGLTLDVAGKQLHVGASLPKTDELSVTAPTKLRLRGLALIEALAAGVPTLASLDTGSTTTVGNGALMDIAI